MMMMMMMIIIMMTTTIVVIIIIIMTMLINRLELNKVSTDHKKHIDVYINTRVVRIYIFILILNLPSYYAAMW
jgi:hypothetical protein